MKVNKRLKAVLKIIIPLLLGIFILFLLYGKMDLKSIADIARHGVNYWIIALSLLFGAGANIIRGLRWQILINTVTEGNKAKKANSILTTLGSYTVNMALPRAGEFWRCAEMGRYEQISFSKLLGTLFIDRITDILMLGLIFLGIFLGAGSFFSEFFTKNPDITSNFYAILGSIWLYVGIVTFGIMLWMIYKYLIKRKPDHKVSMMFMKVGEGLKSIWKMDQKWLFIIYSIAIWMGYFLFFYSTFYAFDFTQTLGIEVGLIAFALSSMAVIVPVQGGVGPWHFLVISALVAFSVNKEDAGAFALIVHTIQTLWITLVGLISIFLLPLVNKNYIRSQNERE